MTLRERKKRPASGIQHPAMSQQAKRTKVSPEEDEESSDSRDSDSPFDDDNSKEDPFPVLSLQSAAYLTFRRSELQDWFDKPVLSFGNE
jgi:hypothetical protein